MVVSKKQREFEVIREGGEEILKVNAVSWPYAPSLEENPLVMVKILDYLSQVPSISRIIINQRRNFNYSAEQTQMLVEIANFYNHLTKQKKLLSLGDIAYGGEIAHKYGMLQYIVFNLLRSDPLGAYVEAVRILREGNIRLGQLKGKDLENEQAYLDVLQYIKEGLGKTSLIKRAKDRLAGYSIGDRNLYKELLRPVVTPDFMFTRLMGSLPSDGEFIDSYNVLDHTVTILKQKHDVKLLYHVVPMEFKVSEDEYELIDLARTVLAEHRPKEEEFLEPERLRRTFINIGKDLLQELAETKGYEISYAQIRKLAKILVRYTIGFGMIEVLLQDPKVQDISVNSPVGENPLYIVHGDYGECVTNIIPSLEDSESWATKLRLLSARPLDEANPILDTELEIPGARARVAVISNPLNPTGLAFSLRKHRDRPWTLPLFINNKMINPLGAGLISFLIDGARTLLVAGTRSSGKTSLLGSFLVEIMRKYRIISVEDTLELPTRALRKLGYNIQSMKVRSALTSGGTEVSAEEGIRTSLRMGDSSLIIGEVRSSLRGNEEVVLVKDGLTKRMQIKDLEGKDLVPFYLPTLDEEDKMKLKKLTGFIKHPKRSQLIKITTKTGREVTVTHDHGVFTHVNFKIASIKTEQLRTGDPVIIPSKLPVGYNDINYLNLLKIGVFKEDYRLENAEPYIRKAIKVLGWRKVSKICDVSDIYRYLLSTQKTRIPIKHFIKLMEKAKIEHNIEELRIKKGTANSIPVKFPINENVLRLIGYYLAEGNIDPTKVQITNSKPAIIKDITEICQKEFGLKVSKRKIKGLGSSVQIYITSKPFMDLLFHLGCGKKSFYKRIPEFVYGLSERKICALLKGMYSGDGSVSSSKGAGNMIRYFSTCKKLVEDVSYTLLCLGIVCRIHSRKPSGKGLRELWIAEIKQRKYIEYFLNNIGFTHKTPAILQKSFSHSKDDSVVFDPTVLEKHLKLPRKYRHLRRTKCCSKDYLKRITEEVKCSDELYDFAHGEFFIDKVKSIEIIKLKKDEYVYDLSVKSTQRFIGGFGGILLHNSEAKALYEAMRIGALANVVAGTIHGDSPYGVFDRVVNDLGVPRTSFKATDIIVITNPVKSADGLHSFRRVQQITEVRKHWEDDPLRENGFVDLMSYDTKKDLLEVSDELINGDSDTLKMIASNIKEFAGDWDAVWNNVLLRAKIKETIVKYANQSAQFDLLEAPFVIASNDMFHRISDEVKQELGGLDNKRIFFGWDEWAKREIKKKQYA